MDNRFCSEDLSKFNGRGGIEGVILGETISTDHHHTESWPSSTHHAQWLVEDNPTRWGNATRRERETFLAWLRLIIIVPTVLHSRPLLVPPFTSRWTVSCSGTFNYPWHEPRHVRTFPHSQPVTAGTQTGNVQPIHSAARTSNCK